MATVLLYFWLVCLLRLSPEISPRHPYYVALVLLANLAVSFIATALITGHPALPIATGVLVSTATLVLLVYFACAFRNLGDRFMRTIATILGCDLVITAILALAVPLTEMVHQAAVGAVYLVFMVWTITVVGFILSKALNLHMALTVCIALTILLISSQLAALASGL